MGVINNAKNELEDVCCGVCGSFDRTHIFDNHDRLHGFPGQFKINRCSVCKLIYLSPRPKNIGEFYVEDYEPYNINLKDFHQSLTNSLMNSYYGEKKSFFQRFSAQIYKMLYNPIPHEYQGKRIMDVGCGNGIFLYNLKKFGGFDPYGIDISEYAVNQAQAKLGLENVTLGVLEDNSFTDDFFDIVTLNHVVEHLSNPTEAIREIKRILKPGGLLMITTPNADSLLFNIFQKCWFALETPRHLNIFSQKTLSRMIDRVDGLGVEKIDFNISNYVFAKSLIYFFNFKNVFLVNLLMRIKFIFLPLFYLFPRGKRDFITIYAKKL